MQIVRAWMCLALLAGCEQALDDADAREDTDAGGGYPPCMLTEPQTLYCWFVDDPIPDAADDETMYYLAIGFGADVDGATHVIDAEVDHLQYYYSDGIDADAPRDVLVAGPSHDPVVIAVEPTTVYQLSGPGQVSRVDVRGSVRVDSDAHGEVHLEQTGGDTVDFHTWDVSF